MRTNVVIDDELMKSALKQSGLKTKKAVIEEGLRLLVELRRQSNVKEFRGKLMWSGNLDKMRTDNDPGGFVCMDRLLQRQKNSSDRLA